MLTRTAWRPMRPLRRLTGEADQVRRMSLVRLRLARGITALLPEFTLTTLRAAFYRWAGFDIGPKVSIQGRLRLMGPGPEIYSRLHIGRGTTIGPGVSIQLDAPVTIGEEVAVGPGTTILTGTHMLGPGSRRMSPAVVGRPVTVGAGAWIGASSLLLPGVEIGAGTVVSAGSVVAESVSPNVLAAGNPASVVQQLPWSDR